MARKPSCQRLPPGRCPGPGLSHRSGERRKSAGVYLLAGAVSSATLRRCLAPAAGMSLPQIYSGVQRKSPHAKAPSRKVLKSKKGCKSDADKPKNPRSSAAIRVLFSFTAWRFLPRRLVHNQVFSPFFSSSAGSAPMQRANICAQRDGLVARGGSSAIRKRALRPSAQIGPSTRPPLARVVSAHGQKTS